MANTLVEYQYLTTDVVAMGIADTIVKESPILARLPMKHMEGNSYLYNLESALAGAGWYAVGDTWVEGTPTWTQRTVGLAILGGDADVDGFARQTKGNVQDIKAAVIEKKAKAISHEFERAFLYGGTTTTINAKEFKGLLQLIAEVESATETTLDSVNNDQVVWANEASPYSQLLSLDNLDELIDAVKPGKPDALLMSRRSRRKLNSLSRASGTTLSTERDQWGKFIQIYDGIAILINDFLEDNVDDPTSAGVWDIAAYVASQTRAATNDNSPIFALKFGEGEGIFGLTNGGVQREDIGTLETKDADRTRIKFYVTAALKQVTGAAVLIGAVPEDAA